MDELGEQLMWQSTVLASLAVSPMLDRCPLASERARRRWGASLGQEVDEQHFGFDTAGGEGRRVPPLLRH